MAAISPLQRRAGQLASPRDDSISVSGALPMRKLFWTAALLVLIGTNRGQDELKAATEPKPGMPIRFEDRTTDASPRDPALKAPAKIHPLPLVQGKTYVIDLVSKEFDAFLRIEDAAGQ